MKEKPLTDWNYEELIDYLTGKAIMALGQGKSLKSIIADAVHMTNMWTWELAKERKNNES